MKMSLDIGCASRESGLCEERLAKEEAIGCRIRTGQDGLARGLPWSGCEGHSNLKILVPQIHFAV
jgi:hypothetical protein